MVKLDILTWESKITASKKKLTPAQHHSIAWPKVETAVLSGFGRGYYKNYADDLQLQPTDSTHHDFLPS